MILSPSKVIYHAETNPSLRYLVDVAKIIFFIGGRSTLSNYIHVNVVVLALVNFGSDPC